MPEFLMDPFELKIIRPHIRELSPRKVYVEIGGWQGGSVGWFGQTMEEGATLISVEAYPKDELKAVLSDLRSKWGYDAHLVDKPSQTPEALEAVKGLLQGRKVDCLLIDGNHHLANVAVDSSRYSPLVRKGGLVIFHDCGICSTNGMPVDRLGINAVWRGLATKRRSLLVQAYHGTGLVWM